MMDSGDFDAISFKVVVVGNNGVGKSSLLQRFHLGEFHQERKPTVGVEHYSHELTVQNQKVKVSRIRRQGCSIFVISFLSAQ